MLQNDLKTKQDWYKAIWLTSISYDQINYKRNQHICWLSFLSVRDKETSGDQISLSWDSIHSET